jgi:hypothetical protein
MIEAIWPQYANLANSIPASQGATSKDFLSFFLFWYVASPLLVLSSVAEQSQAHADPLLLYSPFQVGLVVQREGDSRPNRCCR